MVRHERLVRETSVRSDLLHDLGPIRGESDLVTWLPQWGYSIRTRSARTEWSIAVVDGKTRNPLRACVDGGRVSIFFVVSAHGDDASLVAARCTLASPH